MRPLYYQNAKRNLWATIKPWFSLSYWAYLIIRRKARKSGKPYAVITLPAATARVMTREVTDEDFIRAVAATVPTVFQRPEDPPHAAEAAQSTVQKHFEAQEKAMDTALMKERVQERLAAKTMTPGEVAIRIAEKARAQRLRIK